MTRRLEILAKKIDAQVATAEVLQAPWITIALPAVSSSSSRLTRRDLLHIGGLGAFGLAHSDLFGLAQLSAAPGAHPAAFSKAKACILLYGGALAHAPLPAARHGVCHVGDSGSRCQDR